MLEEEGGGEPVEYSSLQECQIWFENGELCHTLFHLFPCPASVLLSPAASPFPGHSTAPAAAATLGKVIYLREICAFVQKPWCRLSDQQMGRCFLLFLSIFALFLCRAGGFFSCVSVGERSVVSECVSKHRLWVANGACSCWVPHFEGAASICGVLVQSGAAAAVAAAAGCCCCCVPERSCSGMLVPLPGSSAAG